MNKFFVLILALLSLISSQIPAYSVSYKHKDELNIFYKDNPSQWHNRNDHLIPNDEETEAILSLSQDRDFESEDIDKDGVRNIVDPSMYDWREVGFQPFGILEFLSWDHDWNNNKYSKADLERVVKLLSEAGLSFVRMDFLWQDIEPQNNEFNFQKYDFIVDLLAKKNIRILGILGYCASWAGENWNCPARKLEDFIDYVSRVVSRYKDKIKYWEIWNEPDSKTYWQPQDDLKTYTALLKETYLAAKKIDPSCKIVLGGMTVEGFYAIKNVYKNDGKDFFDILNIHPFVNPLETNDFVRIYAIYNNLKKLKERYNDRDKKIWFTEVGCPGISLDMESKGWWFGKSPTEKQQSRFLYYLYTDVIELPDLEKVFWAFFRDNKDHFKNDVDFFGLIRWDFSKKIAFDVFKERYAHWLKFHDYLD